MQPPFDSDNSLFFPMEFNNSNFAETDMLADGQEEEEYSEASGSSTNAAEYRPVQPTPPLQPARSQSSPTMSTTQELPGQPVRRATQPLSEKRKMQNRAAQKSFRERRDRYLKDLEEKVANQAELDAHTNARIRNLEAENAALRRLLSQSILPPGSQLSLPEPKQSLWPDSALLDSGRPASASSSEVDQLLNRMSNSPADRTDNMSIVGTSSSTPMTAVPASFPSMGMPAPFTGSQPPPQTRPQNSDSNQHYSVLEDVDVVDWRYAWAQLCSHPQYAEVDRDSLWSDLRKQARYCVDRPPVIQTEELDRLKESIPQRARRSV